MTSEQSRLQDAKKKGSTWKKWGPYLSERQWGTVREDYSESGNAWEYFPHDHARSRAYQWGEDGLAGISDDKQLLCFALALWNGKDPIIKERLFGLDNNEGNHGEDVKECYFYLDSTPTHSYMKYLYKYPQCAYPYDEIVKTNHGRSRNEPEYELFDTGVFDKQRYHDVFVEYAKNSPEDILIKITVCNRGDKAATIHVLPTLWFRNTWSWGNDTYKPKLKRLRSGTGLKTVSAEHQDLGTRYFYCEGNAKLLFVENETNNRRLFRTANASAFTKDGINDYLVQGKDSVINPAERGTKVAAHYTLEIPPQAEVSLRLRLSDIEPAAKDNVQSLFGSSFEKIFRQCRKEADDFYSTVIPSSASADEALVMRQALAGMLWSKQYYYLDLNSWLKQHGAKRFSQNNSSLRNHEWAHLNNSDIISMPDKWEYPWYAAWDLAFHTIALGLVDSEFAKQQLLLLLDERYQHPNGQIPAYEWKFSDVNPPVHACATLALYQMEKRRCGEGDITFLKKVFNKLLLNFTWWVNRKDRQGHNIFEGGFLGLDNIGVFDRSSALPTGGYLEQADGTAWMALYCQNMLEIAGELAAYDPAYEDLVVKFGEHFLLIAAAMNRVEKNTHTLWDETDGFYFDLLRTPDGRATRLKTRSLVGLLPLCAVTVLERYQREKSPAASTRLAKHFIEDPELKNYVHHTGPGKYGKQDRSILALVDEKRLRRVLSRMLDEQEFLSPYGIRSLSRHHAQHPYRFLSGRDEYRVEYTPGDSTMGTFGGNSNWRGPIWFPMNILLMRALTQYYMYYGDSFKIECPTGSGNSMNLYQVAHEIGERLTRLFLRNTEGRRPCHGLNKTYWEDPHWRNLILFYEYFHGDNGSGVGANHQTGWTGLVATIIEMFCNTTAKTFLKNEKGSRKPSNTKKNKR